ncbi:MAG: LPP20 family lipoprotein [Candidatus Cloacimonetes bacterium]|nr:LPP20 family lipoprotein [Candidatus Cloacimonadota bacterium]
MKKTVLLLIIMILVISCVAHAKKKKSTQPEWLKNPKVVYSEQQYLTAIGEGDSRSSAENMAAGNLARIFESNVKAEETVTQRYFELTKNKKTSIEEQTEVNKNVNIQAQQTLFNIQFGESYTDDLGRVYAIAYLNRFKTAEIYESKIDKNSQRIEYFVKSATETNDPLMKYAAGSAALTVSAINEVLLAQLSIIFPSAIDMLEISYQHEKIVKLAKEAATAVTCGININNDKDNKITIMLEEMVNDLGFILSKDNVLRINGNILLEKTDLKRNLEFVRYELQISVKDDKDDTIVSMTEKGREGHVSALEARERALRTLGKVINKQLKSKLINYFDSLIME